MIVDVKLTTDQEFKTEFMETRSAIDSNLIKPTGENGLSAFEIAVANGFVGTEKEWLNSLKGAQGPKGDTGETGPQGEVGPKGDKGDAPVKGTDYYTEEEKQALITEIENEVTEDLDALKPGEKIADAGEIFNDYDNNTAEGLNSHAEGEDTHASGACSHAEGWSNSSPGPCAHSEGGKTVASSHCSHSEGYQTEASGERSHAEGWGTQASGQASHAEGYQSSAAAQASHAEGWQTKAIGQAAHAEGWGSQASGSKSHAEGHGTKASGENSHAQGRYNIEDTANKYAHIVGNGRSDNARSNAHTLDWDGNAWFAGVVTIGSDKDALITEKSVDQTYSSTSENAQSGKAVNEAVEPKLDKPSMPPTVGNVLKVLSLNEDGTFTCEWSDIPSGGVRDVTVGGKSIVNDGVAKIPDANNVKRGTFYLHWANPDHAGIACDKLSGGFYVVSADKSDIDTRTQYNKLIKPSNIDMAVKAAMCDGKGEAWTDTERIVALLRMGCTVDDNGFVKWTAQEVSE